MPDRCSPGARARRARPLVRPSRVLNPGESCADSKVMDLTPQYVDSRPDDRDAECFTCDGDRLSGARDALEMATLDESVTERPVIMVVDDSPTSLLSIAHALRGMGCEVVAEENGEQALAALDTVRPNLILLDVLMPGMDGFEVCRQLKSREAAYDIPIIFLSAITEVEQRVEGLKLGAVDFVSKPFPREELLARVRTHLELRRLRDDLEHQADDLRLANERYQAEITERRRMRTQLAHLNAELKRRVSERAAQPRAANRSSSPSAYSVSHDLRAPLRAHRRLQPGAARGLWRRRSTSEGAQDIWRACARRRSAWAR